MPLLRSALARLDDVENLLIFRDPEHFLFRPLEVTTGIGPLEDSFFILSSKKGESFVSIRPEDGCPGVKIFVYTCGMKSLWLGK